MGGGEEGGVFDIHVTSVPDEARPLTLRFSTGDEGRDYRWAPGCLKYTVLQGSRGVDCRIYSVFQATQGSTAESTQFSSRVPGIS